MMINPKNSLSFKLNSIPVYNQTTTLLRQQLQYYLSPINLLTDIFLQNIIKSSKGGWIELKIFLKFNKIEEIFKQGFNKELNGKQKRYILARIIQDSSLLQTSQNCIRIKGTRNLSTSFDRCLYIQGVKSEEQLRRDCISIGIAQDMLRIRNGNSNKWFIVQCQSVQMVDMFIEKQNVNFQGRIIKGGDFLTLQSKYQELTGLAPIQGKMSQSQARYKIPAGRTVSYREIQDFKVGSKVRKLKLSKKYQTRLPRRYISAKKLKSETKSSLEPSKLENQGLDAQKKSKDKEQQRQYQKRKMIERKWRKKERGSLKEPNNTERMMSEEDKEV